MTDERIDTAGLDGAEDSDLLALMFLDEYGDLRIVHECPETRLECVLQVTRRAPRGRQHTDQRQRDGPVARNAHLQLRQLAHQEDVDDDDVTRAQWKIVRRGSVRR